MAGSWQKAYLLCCLVILVSTSISMDKVPTFANKLPLHYEFSNATGGQLKCSVHDGPSTSQIEWLLADGTPVNINAPGLRRVIPDGTMLFPPFRAEDYRQDIHAVAYHCAATNSLGTVVSHAVQVRGVVVHPFDIHVYDIYAIKGNSALMRCHIPEFLVNYVTVTAWIRDSVVFIFSSPLNSTSKYLMLASGNLLIRDVQMNDGSTTFRCKAIHRLTGEEKVSNTAGRLIVTESRGNVPPKILRNGDSFVVEQHKSIFLPCIATGYLNPDCKWYRQNTFGTLEAINQTYKHQVEFCSLFITNSESSDSGTYICTASNDVGSDKWAVQLQVLVPLTVTLEPTEATVDAGKILTMECRITGSPVKSIKWLKDGKSITETGYAQSSNNTLTILSMDALYSGIYQCFALNDHEAVFGIAVIHLGDAMPIIIEAFDEKTLHPGQNVSLTCIGNGIPEPTIKWALDNIVVSQWHEQMKVDTTHNSLHQVVSHLLIFNAKAENGGLYSCILENSAGKVYHHKRINVYGHLNVRQGVKINAISENVVEINCPFYGYPFTSISWQKNGVVLPDNIYQAVYDNGSLVVSNVNPRKDNGIYTCMVKDTSGRVVRGTVEIIVMVPPKILPFSFQEEQIQEGTRARLQCVVSEGETPIKIQWLKDGLSVPSGLGINIRDIDEFSSILTITTITPRHNGNYSCFATNIAGHAQHTTPLFVNVPPTWIIKPDDVILKTGRSVTLDCKADGFPMPEINWRKVTGQNLLIDNVHIENNGNRRILSNNSLHFLYVSKSDEGKYLCLASNGVGHPLSKVITLKVKAAPEFEEKYDELRVTKGDKIHLACKAEGDWPIAYFWEVNNRSISEGATNHRYKVELKFENNANISTLGIAWVDKKDSTVFTCQAKNDIGSDYKYVKLIVQEIPEAPKIIDYLVLNQSVVLNWTAPYGGNSAILRYIIQYKEKSETWISGIYKSASVAGTMTTCFLNDFEPASYYVFRLFAENLIGNGTYSDEIIIKTDDSVPTGPPQNVEVESIDASTLRVTWKPPPKHLWNGAITGYLISYKMENSEHELSTKQLEVPEDYTEDLIYQLANLQMYTEYSVVVQAFNSKGIGPQSVPVIAVTSEDVPSTFPQDVRCSALSSRSVYVLWAPPSTKNVNGILKGFKVLFKPADEWYDAMLQQKVVDVPKVTLQDLEVNTNYSIQVVAFTKVGDGKRSPPVYCKTHEDVPEPPIAIKVLPSSADSVVVSWNPSTKNTGKIQKYNVFYAPFDGKEFDPKVQMTEKFLSDASVVASETDSSFINISKLKKNQKYAFWVTAISAIGESVPSTMVAQTVAESIVAAKLVSFDETIKTEWKKDVVLSCKAVGVPAPQRKWLIEERQLASDNGKISFLDNGGLVINKVTSDDSGNYTCSVYNEYGQDEVKYNVIVQVPPAAPSLEVVSKSQSSIQIQWKPGPDGGDRIKGYLLYHKRDRDSWMTQEIRPEHRFYTLDGLACGATYQLYMQAFNSIGTSAPCDVITVPMDGTNVEAPSKEALIHEGSTFTTLHLDQWPPTSCPVLHFGVEYKMVTSKEWVVAGSNVSPTQKKLVVSSLKPATWYILRLLAETSGGTSVFEYKFATLTVSGGTIAPELYENINPMYIFYLDPWIFIPAVSLLLVVIVASVSVCICFKWKNGKESHPLYAGGSQTNTWLRSSRSMSMGSYGRSGRDSTLTSRKSIDPYATSRLSDCYPEGLIRAAPASMPPPPPPPLPGTHNFQQTAAIISDFNNMQETSFASPSAFSTPQHDIRPNDGYDPPPRAHKL